MIRCLFVLENSFNKILQVCDHLRAAAKFTNIRVVPIVGGLAPQKQERLLKKRPHIIVGTPGRLWELMAGGERHLVEVGPLVTMHCSHLWQKDRNHIQPKLTFC